MAERREDIIAAVPAHGADDVSHRAGLRVRAFYEREIAVLRRAKQRLEVGAGRALGCS